MENIIFTDGAMLNFITMIGFNDGTDKEIFTMDELIQAFDLEKVQKGGAIFNPEKLLWINKEHIKKLPSDDFKAQIKLFFPIEFSSLPNFDETLARLEPELRERISYFGEIQEMYLAGDLDMFFKSPMYKSSLLFCPEKQRKGREVTNESLIKVFNDLKAIFVVAPEKISSEEVKNLIWNYAESEGRGIVLHALRVALSGKERSPDPFSLTAILGKEEVLKRIDYALQNLNENI
jgi:glutamyl-tRNA synthetase